MSFYLNIHSKAPSKLLTSYQLSIKEPALSHPKTFSTHRCYPTSRIGLVLRRHLNIHCSLLCQISRNILPLSPLVLFISQLPIETLGPSQILLFLTFTPIFSRARHIADLDDLQPPCACLRWW